MFFQKLLVTAILTEAISEIISSGTIFSDLRDRLWGYSEENPLKLKEKGNLVGRLISCGYCLSFWFGILIAYALNVSGELSWLKQAEPLVWGIVAHRAANLAHGAWTTLKQLRDSICFRIAEGARK